MHATLKVCNSLFDKYAIFDTYVSVGIGNTDIDYGGHTDIKDGALLKVADGWCTKVTVTDIFPILTLPVEANKFSKIKGRKLLLSPIQA